VYPFTCFYKDPSSIKGKHLGFSAEDWVEMAGHHEAAHAVVGLRLGYDVKGLTLEITDAGVRGFAYVDLEHKIDSPEAYRAMAVLIAGGLGHHRVISAVAPEEASHDQAAITNILNRCLPGHAPAQRNARMRATEIAQNILDYDWKFVSVLANALIAWRLIERPYLMKIAE